MMARCRPWKDRVDRKGRRRCRDARRNSKRRWPTTAGRLFFDAWVFFTLLLLIVVAFALLWPLQGVDRVFGTRIVERFIAVIERVGDL